MGYIYFSVKIVWSSLENVNIGGIMKTNFARHYKFSLSKKAVFFISTVCTVLLLAGIAFAISQNASANDEGVYTDAEPNFTIQLKVEGDGQISRSS